jgi:DMSO/TMAO reductase YedYZ molybdopterin-dependent catalytic subunit
MSSFISGPILQVQLDASSLDEGLQDVSDTVTRWNIINVFEIDSNTDENIHWARNQIFSVLLNPGVVQGLDLSSKTLNQLRLERVFDSFSGTETWRVL